MRNATDILKNEEGSTIIVAILILVFLTIIGISAINNSRFESQIVGNEHRYQIDFYVADSGWKEAAMWLNGLASAPGEKNANDDSIVKNYGFNTPRVTNPADPTPTDLSVLQPDNIADTDGIDNDQDGATDEAGELSLSQHGVPYWYQVEYISDTWAAGEGKNVREFTYRARSNANQTQEVEVIMTKKFKVGTGS